MTILYAEEFRKQFRKLPDDVQRLFRVQEERFRIHARDPRLHVKQLRGYPFVFSFRITRRYRVLFYFSDPDIALFATIGHRKDAYD